MLLVLNNTDYFLKGILCIIILKESLLKSMWAQKITYEVSPTPVTNLPGEE